MAEPDASGSFRTKKATGPAIVVDCSGWVDTSQGDWAAGTFVTRKATGPVVAVDCSGWGKGPERLELVVDVRDDVTTETVTAFTKQVVELIAAIDPELRLTYDAERTRSEAGAVRVILTPAIGATDVGKRIADVIAIVNNGLGSWLKDAPAFVLREAA